MHSVNPKKLWLLALICAVALFFAWFFWGARKGLQKGEAARQQANRAGGSTPDATKPNGVAVPTKLAPSAIPLRSQTGSTGVEATFPQGSLWVDASWGKGPGQLGRLHAYESNPEDPMSLAMGPHGEVCVLDQVNDRLQCFAKDGSLAHLFRLGRETSQDLLMDRHGGFAVLDRLGKPALLLYSATGKLISEIPLLGSGIAEGGGITALLSDANGRYYVEIEHGAVVRIAGSEGRPDEERPIFPGRPTRDGKYFVAAQLQSAAAGDVLLQLFNQDKSLIWGHTIRLMRAISHLVLLDSDKQGNILLGAVVPKSAGLEAALQIVRVQESDGLVREGLLLPAQAGAHERFRELVVTDEGSLIYLQSSAQGAKIKKYQF